MKRCFLVCWTIILNINALRENHKLQYINTLSFDIPPGIGECYAMLCYVLTALTQLQTEPFELAGSNIHTQNGNIPTKSAV